jgi:hypothetical protein
MTTTSHRHTLAAETETHNATVPIGTVQVLARFDLAPADLSAF